MFLTAIAGGVGGDQRLVYCCVIILVFFPNISRHKFPLITKAGAHIEVLLNATTRRDEQGNVIGVVGIGQDITTRLAQEREYSKLIDTANAPIFGVDMQG